MHAFCYNNIRVILKFSNNKFPNSQLHGPELYFVFNNRLMQKSLNPALLTCQISI